MHVRRIKKEFVDTSLSPKSATSGDVNTAVADVLRSPHPIQLSKTNLPENSEVWWSKDAVFGFPRSIFFSQLRNNATKDGHPENGLLSTIFSQLVARKYFQASQTGLSYSIGVGIDGISLQVDTYLSALLSFNNFVLKGLRIFPYASATRERSGE